MIELFQVFNNLNNIVLNVWSFDSIRNLLLVSWKPYLKYKHKDKSSKPRLTYWR